MALIEIKQLITTQVRTTDLRDYQLNDFVTFCIQVTEYLLDHQWIFDARYNLNLNRTTALLTGFYCYPKNPFLLAGHRALRPASIIASYIV